MTFKRLLTCAALAVCAAFPASAFGQAAVPPPQADNYLQPLFLNDTTQVFPYNDPIGFTANTSTYTTQADLFNPPSSGGPAEITRCGNSNFSNTIWAVYYAHHWGRLHIDTAGAFDSVIAFIPFRSPDQDPTPLYQFATCIDALSGFQESDTEVVFPGSWWAIQVGGTGTPTGGSVQEKFELKKLSQVAGQAFLFWDRGGRRVTKMYAQRVTRGATVTLSCTKGACKKRKINVKGKRSLSKLFTSAGLVPVSSGNAKMKGGAPAPAGSVQSKRLARAAATDPTVQAAAKRYNLLHNRNVKPGAKIQLRITKFGFFGKYFQWTVQRHGISGLTIRCMNPDSTKPRKKCHG